MDGQNSCNFSYDRNLLFKNAHLLSKNSIMTDHTGFFHDVVEKKIVELRKLNDSFQSKIKLLKQKGWSEDEIEHEMDNDDFEIDFLSATIEIFCCLTIESLLNEIGGRLYGQYKYNKETNENKCIYYKLKIVIIDNCKDPELSKIFSNVFREMFSRRNQLLHPKPYLFKSVNEAVYNDKNLNINPLTAEDQYKRMGLLISICWLFYPGAVSYLDDDTKNMLWSDSLDCRSES